MTESRSQSVVPAEEPGPMRRNLSMGRGVWVPAFAGTTTGDASAGHTSRRAFLGILGGAAAAWPLAARGQRPATPVIGFLSPAESPDSYGERLPAFRSGLEEMGFAEGRNVAIEFRWSNGQYDQLAAFAADLVRRNVALITATGTPAVLAAKAATTTVPIVFTTGGDPVRLGLVPSMNRPGGNVTGVAFLVSELISKQFDLLHKVVPEATAIGLLVNPNNPQTETQLRDVPPAIRALGLQLIVLKASTEHEIDAAFADLVRQRGAALVLGADGFFITRRDQLVALAARYRVPAIYNLREYAAAGGLMSYGTSIEDAYRQTGIYAGRILKGEKLADLPVMQSTKFEFVINLKTARTLGLNIPSGLLAIADEVIE